MQWYFPPLHHIEAKRRLGRLDILSLPDGLAQRQPDQRRQSLALQSSWCLTPAKKAPL
jgi:hypothetical protein